MVREGRKEERRGEKASLVELEDTIASKAVALQSMSVRVRWDVRKKKRGKGRKREEKGGKREESEKKKRKKR